MRLELLALVPAILMVSACASPRPYARGTSDERLSRQSRALVEEILAANANIEPDSRGQVPVAINSNVRKWIDYFAVRDRERFARFLARGERYRPQVSRVLRGNGIPKELYYLAMIESGFQPHAVSPQRAVGVWQFMRPTAERYGLRVSRRRDERRDVARSTRAAARYLSDLHDEFGSWYLAIAAYNAGEGRIRGAIARGGTRDFWRLARMGVLPRETMEYVPKFLAALIIGKSPERYGFRRIVVARNGG